MDCTRVAADEIADQYLLGHLSEADRAAYESHFFVCERCIDELRTLESLRTELQQTMPVESAEPVRRRRHSWVWAAAAAAGLALPFVMWSGARLLAPTSDRDRTAVMLTAPQLPPTPAQDTGLAALAELSRIEPPPYLSLTVRSEEDARIRFEAAMTAYTRGEYATAATALEEVVSLQPSNTRALFFLGISYLMVDRADAATTVLQRCAAAGDPVYSDEARYFMAKALLRKGDRTGAAAALDVVVRSNSPRADDARRLRDALATLPAR
jgi:TolA-binding protein